MSAALHPLVHLKGRLEALVDVLRGAIEETREGAALTTVIADYARELTSLATALPPVPRALELASDLIELVSLMILLKSVRLLERIARPPDDPDARAVLLRLIKAKAEALREEIDVRLLPVRPVPRPGLWGAEPMAGRAVSGSSYEVISLDEIADSLDQVLSEIESTPHAVHMDRPTVAEVIERVLILLSEKTRIVLQRVWGEAAGERVAYFLACLQLAFGKRVVLEQEHPGCDLVMIGRCEDPMHPRLIVPGAQQRGRAIT